MIYFTSDNHFNHEKVIEFEDRPFESVRDMDETMIQLWNRRVQANDEIYILGDFIFDRHGKYAQDILKRLNGKKRLVKGNHDYFINKINPNDYFEWVKDYHRINLEKMRIILFHYPIFQWDCKQHGSIHLHGHSHKASKDFEKDLGLAYNVGVDVNNYAPISLDEILDKLGIGVMER